MAAPIFNDAETYKFEMGKGITLRDGKDVTIVATGILVGEAIKAGELLAAEGIDTRIINIHTIKPIDKELMIKASRRDRSYSHLRGTFHYWWLGICGDGGDCRGSTL